MLAPLLDLVSLLVSIGEDASTEERPQDQGTESRRRGCSWDRMEKGGMEGGVEVSSTDASWREGTIEAKKDFLHSLLLLRFGCCRYENLRRRRIRIHRSRLQQGSKEGRKEGGKGTERKGSSASVPLLYLPFPFSDGME